MRSEFDGVSMHLNQTSIFESLSCWKLSYLDFGAWTIQLAMNTFSCAWLYLLAYQSSFISWQSVNSCLVWGLGSRISSDWTFVSSSKSCCSLLCPLARGHSASQRASPSGLACSAKSCCEAFGLCFWSSIGSRGGGARVLMVGTRKGCCKSRSRLIDHVFGRSWERCFSHLYA